MLAAPEGRVHHLHRNRQTIAVRRTFMPKISVIIPVFNVENHINECLNSVLAQTLSDIEVICIDDASVDNSLRIIESLSEKDPRIKIIKFERNMSASQARKRGVEASSG